MSSPHFIELPGDLEYTELHFHRKMGGRASSFVWITGAGLYSGNFSFGSQNAGDSVIVDFNLLAYPQPEDPPIACGVTEFHMLLLFPTCFLVYSRLSEERVCEVTPRYGEFRGMCYDPVGDKHWVFTELEVRRFS